MARKTFDQVVSEQVQDKDGFWTLDVDRKFRLPRIGARCLFRFHKGAPINGRGCFAGFCAFGYLIDRDVVYVPMYHDKVSVFFVDAWKPEEGPDYWNGSNRSVNEAFQ